MKRFSTRQRVLVGALAIAGIIGGVDRFTGGGAPAPARGAPTAQTPAAAAPAGWNDVNALVDRLTRTDYAPVTDELEQLPRDIFTPTSVAGGAFAAAEAAPTVEAAEPPPPAEQLADFQDRHRLSGVMLGETPLAVIDDQLQPLYADVDGFTLVQIERDYVVFQQAATDTRIVLELAQRPKNP